QDVRGRFSLTEQLESRVLLSSYYVSPLGSDANPGTSDRPWLTLQKAANSVVAGDFVTVRAGTYSGFNLTRDGTATSRITFHAESGVVVNQPNSNNSNGIN